MNHLLRQWAPSVVAAVVLGGGATAGVLVWGGGAPGAAVGGLAVALLVLGLWPLKSSAPVATTDRRRRSSTDLERDHNRLREDLAVLQSAYELQVSVFEVSAELVSCVDEDDARNRFENALRTWWRCSAVDLFVWERGSWRSLGGDAAGEEPMLTGPVQMPQDGDGDLVLDLSPAVDGQAAVVLRGAQPQPSLGSRTDSDQRYVAEVLRIQLALCLRRVILFQELQRLGRIDPLTTCHRRWYGMQRLEEQVEQGLVLAVAMIDIDHFKGINDSHGHAAGDEVLKAVGRCLTRFLRSGDLVSRWGGEEFLVSLPNTSATAAMQVAERLRQQVAVLSDLPSSVTVSVGVAACRMDETAGELVKRADEALYTAKNGGRNRVVLAPGDDGDEALGGKLVRTTQRAEHRTTSVVGRHSTVAQSGFFKGPEE